MPVLQKKWGIVPGFFWTVNSSYVPRKSIRIEKKNGVAACPIHQHKYHRKANFYLLRSSNYRSKYGSFPSPALNIGPVGLP